jgi:hypothetical protein
MVGLNLLMGIRKGTMMRIRRIATTAMASHFSLLLMETSKIAWEGVGGRCNQTLGG